ncbi:hypothetical protein HAX54_020661 [Datura stramonium]|uniref:Uncharacterized protein n=1 Tax=Datura stramonium TaxID=4076 RepID=A0ABS8S347_DATST|nr:hypothetical protein [Datura stramonium]
MAKEAQESRMAQQRGKQTTRSIQSEPKRNVTVNSSSGKGEQSSQISTKKLHLPAMEVQKEATKQWEEVIAGSQKKEKQIVPGGKDGDQLQDKTGVENGRHDVAKLEAAKGLLSGSDRIGGIPVTWSEVVDFKNCVEDCGLIELPHQETYILGVIRGL